VRTPARLTILLAILCAWYYPITREKHRALLNELAEREV
jgi:Na+/melibiose symporter-like transporter